MHPLKRYLSLEEGWVSAEGSGQNVVIDFVTKIPTEDTEIICNVREQHQVTPSAETSQGRLYEVKHSLYPIHSEKNTKMLLPEDNKHVRLGQVSMSCRDRCNLCQAPDQQRIIYQFPNPANWGPPN